MKNEYQTCIDMRVQTQDHQSCIEHPGPKIIPFPSTPQHIRGHKGDQYEERIEPHFSQVADMEGTYNQQKRSNESCHVRVRLSLQTVEPIDGENTPENRGETQHPLIVRYPHSDSRHEIIEGSGNINRIA